MELRGGVVCSYSNDFYLKYKFYKWPPQVFLRSMKGKLNLKQQL